MQCEKQNFKYFRRKHNGIHLSQLVRDIFLIKHRGMTLILYVKSLPMQYCKVISLQLK